MVCHEANGAAEAVGAAVAPRLTEGCRACGGPELSASVDDVGVTGGVDTGGGATVSNDVDDHTATMRAVPRWRETLVTEHAAMQARLRQAIEADEEHGEAV